MMLHEQKPSLEEVIEHYGVKGMRWGVRRSAAQLGRSTKKARDSVAKKSQERRAKKATPEARAKSYRRKRTASNIARGAAFVALLLYAASPTRHNTTAYRTQTSPKSKVNDFGGVPNTRYTPSSNTFKGFSVNSKGEALATNLKARPQTRVGADWVVSSDGQAAMADWRR